MLNTIGKKDYIKYHIWMLCIAFLWRKIFFLGVFLILHIMNHLFS